MEQILGIAVLSLIAYVSYTFIQCIMELKIKQTIKQLKRKEI